MKIGIILPGFSASEDDWCIPALRDLAKCLAARPGVELHLFPLRYPPHRRSYDVFGAHVHPLGGVNARGVVRVSLLSRAVRAIWQEHHSGPFDLLHGFWADEPGLIAASCASLLRVPSIVSLAGGELANLPDIAYGGQLNTANRLMTHMAIRRATHVTAGSRYLQDLAGQRTRIKQVLRVPLGVDITRFVPESTQTGVFRDSPQMLSVASLVPIKDQSTLLAAFAGTTHQFPNARLNLVGNGSSRDRLRQQSAELDIAECVVFHGDVTHDKLPDLYRSADFCVLSSRFEAQGMVVLEAAACGTPTLGTRVGVIPEFIDDDAVAVGDVAGLQTQMIQLLQDRQRLGEMGARSLSIVQSEFNLGTTTERLFDLYLNTIAGNQRAQAHPL